MVSSHLENIHSSIRNPMDHEVEADSRGNKRGESTTTTPRSPTPSMYVYSKNQKKSSPFLIEGCTRKRNLENLPAHQKSDAIQISDFPTIMSFVIQDPLSLTLSLNTNSLPPNLPTFQPSFGLARHPLRPPSLIHKTTTDMEKNE